MEGKIIIAGFGGQGVVLAGNLLAYAALEEDKKILGMVSYGAEVRGGASMSSVIISDHEIDCPIIEVASIGIMLSQEAFDKYSGKVNRDGILFVNSSEVKMQNKPDAHLVEIPAAETAKILGNVKVTNLIMIGAVIEKTKIIRFESIISALERIFTGRRKDLLYINIMAINKGAELVRE